VCSDTIPAGKLPAEEAAIKGEGKGPEGRDVGWQNVSGQAAAMHRMDPRGRKPFDATNNAQNRVGTGKYSYFLIPTAHICA